MATRRRAGGRRRGRGRRTPRTPRIGGRRGDRRRAGGAPPRRRSAARKSRPASWPCTSATWRSWTSCARSRSSRPRGRSRRWRSTSGRPSSGFASGADWIADTDRAGGRQAAGGDEGLSHSRREGARTRPRSEARPFRKGGGRAGDQAARDRHRSHLPGGGGGGDPAGRARDRGAAVRGASPVLDHHEGLRDYVKRCGRRHSGSSRPRTSS